MVEAKTTDLTGQREGEIVDCTVEQIMPYGAFVRIIDNGRKGMIHISELSYSFVKNINDVLKINDRIKAKIIRIDERGRIDLSLKQTQEPPQTAPRTSPAKREGRPETFRRPDRPQRKPGEFHEVRDFHEMKESVNPSDDDDSFEKKMSAFLKTSEAKITDLNTRNSARSSRSSRGSKGRRNNGGY